MTQPTFSLDSLKMWVSDLQFKHWNLTIEVTVDAVNEMLTDMSIRSEWDGKSDDYWELFNSLDAKQLIRDAVNQLTSKTEA